MANDQNSQEKKENLRDNIALIIGTLFLLGLTFLAYNQFNKSDSDARTENQEPSAMEKIKEAISASTQRDEEDNNEDNNGNTDEENTNTNGQTDEQVAPANIGGMTERAWTANDYTQGDIESGSYTVKAGDTLWEIAEAVYGNGAEWTQILEANSSNVGYLANGQQALITTGQVLSIP